jgi:hypothetical protein
MPEMIVTWTTDLKVNLKMIPEGDVIKILLITHTTKKGWTQGDIKEKIFIGYATKEDAMNIKKNFKIEKE